MSGGQGGPVPGPPRPGPPPLLPPALGQAEQRLAGLGDLPLEEQVAGYDEVHRLLQDALAALDDAAS